MTYDWVGLEQKLDGVVDDMFAEDVTLIPWVSGDTVYIPGEEGPDPTRKVVATQGCFVTPGASLVGEGGRATGGGFNTQVLESECWLSVTLDRIGGSVTLWRTYDRVFLPLRGWFSISYLDDSATLRPNIHLIRTHDIAWGLGAPSTIVTPAMKNQLYYDARGNRFYRAMGTTSSDWVVV